jgi:hypothetical protein
LGAASGVWSLSAAADVDSTVHAAFGYPLERQSWAASAGMTHGLREVRSRELRDSDSHASDVDTANGYSRC